GKRVTGVSEPLRKALAVYDWPGNVRELRNLMGSMGVQDQDGILGLDDFQEDEHLGRWHLPDLSPAGPANLVGGPLNQVERYYIEKALELTSGNREEAARMLGIGERTLYRVIQDWKLQDKIRQALTDAGGNMEEAARALCMKEQALQRKIKKLGIPNNQQ